MGKSIDLIQEMEKRRIYPSTAWFFAILKIILTLTFLNYIRQNPQMLLRYVGEPFYPIIYKLTVPLLLYWSLYEIIIIGCVFIIHITMIYWQIIINIKEKRKKYKKAENVLNKNRYISSALALAGTIIITILLVILIWTSH